MDDKEMKDIFANLEEPPVVNESPVVTPVLESQPAFQVAPAYQRPWFRRGSVVWLAVLVLLGGSGTFAYVQYRKPTVTPVEEKKMEVVVPINEAPVITEEVPQFVPLQDKDTDGDGLLDQREKEAGTNVTDKDTDDDGLSDFMELQVYGTDPLVADTDKDGFSDGQEVQSGYNPKGDGKLIDLQKEIMNRQN